MDALPSDDPLAVELLAAIQAGDLPACQQLLGQHPGLASARVTRPDGSSRTPLHVVTDWPGYFPHGPAGVRLLLDAGADPDAPVTGARHAETPLHWAASSDDVDVAAALIDGGANIDAPGASIAGGTPLDDAVGYGCWHVARLLLDRGARVDALGTRPHWACCPASRSCSTPPRFPAPMTSTKRSGRPVTAGNAESPNISSPAAPTSTPPPATPTRPRSTSPPASTPAGTPSCRGCGSTAPPRPRTSPDARGGAPLN